jgi:hypothetical protein
LPVVSRNIFASWSASMAAGGGTTTIVANAATYSNGNPIPVAVL